jgi:D-tyrosyl-tRNA(Tyr) deacylase
MKALVQRIARAEVRVDHEVSGSADTGLIVYLGVCETDTEVLCEKAASRILNLRIFTDARGKMNLSVKDIGGDILLISQFTLCADTKKGNRPSFNHAMAPDEANVLFGKIKRHLQQSGLRVETGVFGAHMMVEYVNDGPVTIMLEL